MIDSDGDFQDQRHHNPLNEYKIDESRGIYTLLSKVFDAEISSYETAETFLRKFMEEHQSICKYSKKCRSSLILKTESEKKYKSEIAELKRTLTEKETNLAIAETRVKEIQIQHDECQREKEKLESEVKKLKHELRVNKDSYSSSNDCEQTANVFEEVVQSMAAEITRLGHQRSLLLEKIQSFDRLAENFEKEIMTQERSLGNEIESIKTENQELRNNIGSVYSTIKTMVPSELDIDDEDPEKYIVSVVRTLLSSNTSSSFETDEPAVTNNERYECLVGQLEGAMRFIQKISHKESNFGTEALVIDPQTKTLLLTEIARLGRFLDDNQIEIESEASVLNPEMFTNARKQLSGLLSSTPENVLMKSPFREVFALFVGVCEVNNFMVNHIEEMKDRIRKIQASCNVDTYERKISELKSWKHHQNKKMAELAKLLGISNPGDVFQQCADIYNEIINENRTLIEEVSQLRDTHSQIIVENTNLQNIKDQLDLLERDFDAEVAIREEETAKTMHLITEKDLENAKLRKEIDHMKAKLERKKGEIATMKQSNVTTTRLISDITKKIDFVEAENLSLSEKCTTMRNTINKQNEQLENMAKSERKLKTEKQDLKERLQDYEQRNDDILSEIKTRNAKLDEQYNTVMKNLEKEVSTLRSQNVALAVERDNLAHQKKELTDSITKIRMSERAIKLQLISEQERAKIEKSAFTARESSYKSTVEAQANQQVEHLTSEIEKARTILLRILRDNYDIIGHSCAPLHRLASEIEINSERSTTNNKVLNEYLDCRGALSVPVGKSLISAIKEMINEHKAITGVVANLQKDCARLQTEISTKERNDTPVWEGWARSMLARISDKHIIMTPEEMRFSLEESLYASIGYRSVLRRVDSLRAQKKLLARTSQILRKKSAQPVESIRSLMLVAMFYTRMQKLADLPNQKQ